MRTGMIRIESKVGDIWVGVVPQVGPILFDPRAQHGLSDSRVRLYKLSEAKNAVFMKDIVRTAIAPPDDAVWGRLQPALNSYIAAMGRRRVTHCFRCKERLDSVNFSVCNACGWICCDCGACGCDFDHGLIDRTE
jgi:hypothetical protein